MIPSGYTKTRQAPGVELFKRGDNFIQVIHLFRGASLKLLHGAITAWQPGEGAFGGNNARFRMHPIMTFWRYTRSRFPGAFSVINGAFWKVGENPASLALPLKAGGQILTDGFMYHAIPTRVNMLELWSDHAAISELNKNTFYGSSAPDIIGGRNANANMRKLSSIGRTMIGVSVSGRTVYIFSSPAARQNEGYKILRAFGAAKVTQLDGGGSSQLIVRGVGFVMSGRAIPQVVAVVGG